VRRGEEAIDADVALCDHRVKDAAIHAVDVSDASSGTRPSPVRRIAHAGGARRALRSEHHVSMRATKKDWSRSVSRSTWRGSLPKRSVASFSPRSRHASRGASLTSVGEPATNSDSSGARSRAGPRAARARDRRMRGPPPRSPRDGRVRASRRSRARRAPPARVAPLVLETPSRARAAALPRQRLGVESGRPAPLRPATPWNWKRVGGEARGAMQRAEKNPRMAAAHGLVLADRQHGAALDVRERRVIEVLADVVLVLTNGAVVGECEVLCMDQVDRQRRAADVSRGRRARTTRRGPARAAATLEADVAPGAARREAVLTGGGSGAARGPEQRDRVTLRSPPAQIEVGRPPPSTSLPETDSRGSAMIERRSEPLA